MRKALITIIVLLIVAIGGSLYYVRSRGASLLSQYLSSAMGVPVTVDSVEISWNRFAINGLNIHNSQGSVLESAFNAPHILFDIDFMTLWKDKIHATMIHFESPTIGIELYNLTGSDNNWARIINHIPKDQHSHSDKKLYIDTLLITPLHIALYNKAMGGTTTMLNPISKIELHNIGDSESALSYDDALNIIAQAIIRAVIKQTGLNTLLQGVLQLPNGVLDNVLEPLPKAIKNPIKGLFGIK